MVRKKNKTSFCYLLRFILGADKRIRNQDNKTPLDLTHDPNVRSLLEDKGNLNFLYFFIL